MVSPQVYGVKCVDEEDEGLVTGTAGPNGLPPPDYGEAYTNNICILPAAGDPYYVGGGDLADPAAFAASMALANNTVYAPNASATVTLDGGDPDSMYSFGAFQAAGFDPTSNVSGDMPSNAQIIAWGKALLGL